MSRSTGQPAGFAPELLRDVPLTGLGLDRHAERRAEAGLLPALLDDPRTRVLDIGDGRAPISSSADMPRLAWRAPRQTDRELLGFYLGDGRGASHVAVVSSDAVMAGDEWKGLRSVGALLPSHDAVALATAAALANWHGSHRFCPRCGGPTVSANAGWTRHCDADSSEHFPRTDPAVIMAVLDDDDRLLLARHPTWPENRLSVLAGFVEPGETLAAAVRREVAEEVGLQLNDVHYLGDQPWPFPASLMVGFEARAASTELVLDAQEIAEAHWVTRAEYRARVVSGDWLAGTSLSISRRLVEHWLARGPT